MLSSLVGRSLLNVLNQQPAPQVAAHVPPMQPFHNMVLQPPQPPGQMAAMLAAPPTTLSTQSMPLSLAGGAGGGATVRCFHCNEWGHISKFCPRKGSNMRGMRDGREDLDEERINREIARRARAQQEAVAAKQAERETLIASVREALQLPGLGASLGVRPSRIRPSLGCKLTQKV